MAEFNEFLGRQSSDGIQGSDIGTTDGKLEAYTISIYVVTMTLTTVGYGDVSAKVGSVVNPKSTFEWKQNSQCERFTLGQSMGPWIE